MTKNSFSLWFKALRLYVWLQISWLYIISDSSKDHHSVCRPAKAFRWAQHQQRLHVLFIVKPFIKKFRLHCFGVRNIPHKQSKQLLVFHERPSQHTCISNSAVLPSFFAFSFWLIFLLNWVWKPLLWAHKIFNKWFKNNDSPTAEAWLKMGSLYYS